MGRQAPPPPQGTDTTTGAETFHPLTSGHMHFRVALGVIRATSLLNIRKLKVTELIGAALGHMAPDWLSPSVFWEQ